MAIVTLTMNPSIDATTIAKRLLPDRKLRCRQPMYEPGGGGINVARAVNKLGGQALACFPAGSTNGDHLLALLDEEDVESRNIAITGMTRQNVTVREEADEQQYRFVMPGPELGRDEWNRCLKMIGCLDSQINYIVASGSLPPGVPDDFYARLADVAQRQELRLIVDTSGDPLRKLIEKPVFLVKPNVREISNLIGIDDDDKSNIEEATRDLLKEHDWQYTVVSLGAGGALLITGDESKHVRAPTVPIKSKVGAGDSMVGGIVLSLDRNDDILAATRFGVAAGSSAVTTPGTELCRRDKTEELAREMG